MSSSAPQNSEEPSGLLRTLAAVFSGVLFGLFLSKSKAPIQESVNSISPNAEATEENNRRNDLPSLSTQVPPSPRNSENDCKCCRHKTPWWKILLEVGMLIATAGAFVAAGYYAHISKKMWGEMQTQTCIQRNASMNAERAWVGLDGPPVVEIGLLEDRKRMGATINFTVKDYGRGPALSVMAGATITPSDPHNRHVVEDQIETTCSLLSPFVGMKPTRPVSSDEDLVKHQWGHVVFPNQPFSTGTITTIDMPKMVGKEVYVVGCIVYRDQFSEPHWTKFCYNTGDFARDVVKDASSFRHLYMCNANNYTDEIEKKTPSCSVTAVPQ